MARALGPARGATASSVARRVVVAIGLAASLAACQDLGQGPLAPSNNAPTSTSHAKFPITAAPHAQDCNTCHGAAASFQQFDCLGCHGHEQALTDSLHKSVNLYSYASPACYSCHADGARKTFDHYGLPASNCASCHDVAAPFAALPFVPAGGGVFTHPDMSGNDCSKCHTRTTWQNGGVPTGPVSDAAHDLIVNALVATFSGTTITRVDPAAETLPMAMNHASAQIAGAASSTCANCHAGAATGDFYPGDVHASIAALNLAQPATCADCHGDAAPAGFVGPAATSPVRSPATGEMKHDAVRWASGAPTGAKLVTDDCSVCHAPPRPGKTGDWKAGTDGVAPATFHAALPAAGKAQPTGCLDCHANSRPAGVISSTGASLPAGVQFDHGAAEALADCAGCHAAPTASPGTWSGGRFHFAGSANPATCQQCHEGERPGSAATWTSPTFRTSPFDYGSATSGVNNGGYAHGAGLECATCHRGPGTGAWGGTQNWVAGSFQHGPETLSASTCIACHSSQRPDVALQNPGLAATLLGFNHLTDGSGDCYGCHQASTTSAYRTFLNPAAPAKDSSDWKGGAEYPGPYLISSPAFSITVNQITLVRGANNLITGTTSNPATFTNAIVHTSSAIPAAISPGTSAGGDTTKCWHCHTHAAGSTTVNGFAGGIFHDSLDKFSTSPGGAVTPLAQPTTGCFDCHAPMLPNQIVEKLVLPANGGTLAASDLQPMDHAAVFSPSITGARGTAVNTIGGLECANCHQHPGDLTVKWADGVFHANLTRLGVAPQDCTACHYPLMADKAKSDVTSAANFTMVHGSAQMTTQQCQTCHTGALGSATGTPIASGLWKNAALHPTASVQPGACKECHTVCVPASITQGTASYSLPQGATATNTAQWMSHTLPEVAGKDCASCHRSDAKPAGAAWTKTTAYHANTQAPTATCQSCHGTQNGGSTTPGTKNNLPGGPTDSTTLSSAILDAAAGVPGRTFAKMNHADPNATAHDCNFCHAQVGPSTAAGIAGKEWAQAKLHASFTSATPLQLNVSGGRCSSCHLNEKPAASFGVDHSSFTSVSGSQDCASCHTYPGQASGAIPTPNWLGAVGAAPATLNVGGFTIPQPPATTAGAVQSGISNLAHPTLTGSLTCTTCHTGGGGTNAIGYVHPTTLTACNACHEAGSNLVGTAWNSATSQTAGLGDTRPFTLTSLSPSICRTTLTSPGPHFFPSECSLCHTRPATTTTAPATTGATYTTAWKAKHPPKTGSTSAQPCATCHTTSCSDN